MKVEAVFYLAALKFLIRQSCCVVGVGHRDGRSAELAAERGRRFLVGRACGGPSRVAARGAGPVFAVTAKVDHVPRLTSDLSCSVFYAQ